MRFKYYKPIIFLLVFITALIMGIYFESRDKPNFNVNKVDFNGAATIGLTRGDLICSENAFIDLIYQNSTKPISLRKICDVLDDTNKKDL